MESTTKTQNQEPNNYIELEEYPPQNLGRSSTIRGSTHHEPQPSYKKYILPICLALFILGPGLLFIASPGFRHQVIDLGKSLSEMKPNLKTSIIFWTIGFLISLLAQHTGSFEMIIAYVYKRFLTSFFFILSFKLVGFICVYFLVTKIFYSKLESLLESYDLFYLLKYLAVRRPRKSLILMRFSIIPKFIKNYGIPLLGYEFWFYSSITLLSDAYFTLLPVMIGMTARSFVDIEHGESGKNPMMKFTSIAIIIIGLAFFIYFVMYTKRIISKILESQSIEVIKRKLKDRTTSVGSVRQFLGDP